MAPITHPMGDKRNGDVVFRVIGTHLRSVSHIDDKVSAYELKLLCGTCGGRGMLVFYDECPLCSTTGCPSCEKGLVKVRRKCPDKLCGSKQTNKGNRHAKHQIQNKQNGRHHSRRTVQK
ncbi:MAG: hypothetical protein GQ570_03780 [Helicobacteraceae bacterium]|nr:hypothetical protein [Helicobacteraceae bacterium]